MINYKITSGGTFKIGEIRNISEKDDGDISVEGYLNKYQDILYTDNLIYISGSNLYISSQSCLNSDDELCVIKFSLNKQLIEELKGLIEAIETNWEYND
jgi:hypothetical protein